MYGWGCREIFLKSISCQNKYPLLTLNVLPFVDKRCFNLELFHMIRQKCVNFKQKGKRTDRLLFTNRDPRSAMFLTTVFFLATDVRTAKVYITKILKIRTVENFLGNRKWPELAKPPPTSGYVMLLWIRTQMSTWRNVECQPSLN